MFLRFVFLVVFVLSFGIQSAHAQDYSSASWPNLVRTMVRFNALDLTDQPLVDEYLIITECDLYKAFYSNDFKWNQVRQAVRQSVQQNIATFPTSYHYDIKMQLDRYDFAAKLFRFTEKSILKNVNTFVLYSVEGTGCGEASVKYIPRSFRAVLATPLYLEGLPLSDTDAQALLARLEKEQNINRIVYAQFDLRTVYIEPLRKIATKGQEANLRYEQSNAVSATSVRLDTQLDAISFYEDPQLTKLIYRYQP